MYVLVGLIGESITYFQPTICPQQQQYISATVCIPESIILSSGGPTVRFTLRYTKISSITLRTGKITVQFLGSQNILLIYVIAPLTLANILIKKC